MDPHRADVSIRPCTADDVRAVLDLWRRADAVPRPTDTEASLLRRLDRDQHLFVLAVHDSRIVGSLMGGWDGWRGNLYRLAVDPAYRRQGIARRLVARVEQELRAMGAERMTCLVFADDPRAAAFWRSVGYTLDTMIERYAKSITVIAGVTSFGSP